MTADKRPRNAFLRRAAAQGVQVGRPKGIGERPDVFLATPTSQRVIATLAPGLSVRKAAPVAGVTVHTVRKGAMRRKTPEPVRS